MARKSKTVHRLTWNASLVREEVRQATLKAVQDTIDAAAATAASQRNGSIANITARKAKLARDGIEGEWGLFPPPRGGDAFYELFHEAGTSKMRGDHAKRRAADEHYPKLAERIRHYRERG